jgi:lipopolysaccharide transport system permease protein
MLHQSDAVVERSLAELTAAARVQRSPLDDRMVDLKTFAASERVTILEPGRMERNYWSDLWHYRELFAMLAWRDIAVQYKQTVIGIAWAVVRPLVTLLIFTVIFGRMANFPSEGQAPYPVMVFAGMLPWFLMSTVLSNAANSLVTNAPLISKVYFPRLLIPLATSVVALVDAAVTFILMLCVMLLFGTVPDMRILLLPIFVVMALLASLGPALCLSSMNVKYRDFKIVIPFIVQFGLYVSPVGFSSTLVPEPWRWLYSLNPAVGVIDGFRWCLLGQSDIYWAGLGISLLVITFSLWFGIKMFRATERTFADLV